jgi:hypothetical protein
MPTVSNETSLSEGQVVDIIQTAVENQFPKDCAPCGRRFNSMKEYLESTVHLGQPRSYDADMKDWQPSNPMGTFSFSACKCGNTLVLGSSSVEVETMCQLLDWVKKEGQRRGLSIGELLNDLRAKMNAQVLKKS